MALNRVFNIAPSLNIADDFTIHDARNRPDFPTNPVTPQNQNAIDLREGWWDVGDQGQTGSCVGWALADSLLRWHFVQSGQIAQGDHLSARFIWMAAKETDTQTDLPTTFIEKAFTSIKAALDIALDFGAVLEIDLPFDQPLMFDGTVVEFYNLAGALKIDAYYNLDNDFDELKWWLLNVGPVLVRVDVDSKFIDAKSTTADLSNYVNPLFGHAAAIVGFNGDDYILRNSWGTQWGDNGFATLDSGYASQLIQEMYGVVV